MEGLSRQQPGGFISPASVTHTYIHIFNFICMSSGLLWHESELVVCLSLPTNALCVHRAGQMPAQFNGSELALFQTGRKVNL